MTYVGIMLAISLVWFAKEARATGYIIMLLVAAELVLGANAVIVIYDLNEFTTPVAFAWAVGACFLGFAIFTAGVIRNLT